MEQSLDFLVQTLLNVDLRAEQETMKHYQETILQADHATEFMSSAKLVDIVTQEQHHEVDLEDALGLR